MRDRKSRFRKIETVINKIPSLKSITNYVANNGDGANNILMALIGATLSIIVAKYFWCSYTPDAKLCQRIHLLGSQLNIDPKIIQDQILSTQSEETLRALYNELWARQLELANARTLVNVWYKKVVALVTREHLQTFCNVFTIVMLAILILGFIFRSHIYQYLLSEISKEDKKTLPIDTKIYLND